MDDIIKELGKTYVVNMNAWEVLAFFDYVVTALNIATMDPENGNVFFMGCPNG